MAIKKFEPLQEEYIKHILIALLVRNVHKLKSRHGLQEILNDTLERKEFKVQYSKDLRNLDEVQREAFYEQLRDSILNAELSFGEKILERGFDNFEKDDEETLLYSEIKNQHKKNF